MNKADKLNLYQATLAQSGNRMTEQRRAICEHLASISSHPTAQEILLELTRQHPEISRATVYNTLNALKELGAIVEISFSGDHSRYETDPTPHTNLICLRCHRVIDYDPVSQTETLLDQVKNQTDFYPLTVRIDMLGFCAECRQERKREIHQQWQEQSEAHI